MIPAALVLFALASEPAEAPAAEPLDVKPHGVLVGDDWRFQHHSLLGGLVKRTLADLVAMPSGVGGWSLYDFAIFTIVMGSTAAFEWPGSPSIDVRLMTALQNKLGQGHLELWTPMGDTIIWLTLFTSVGALLAYGLVTDDRPWLETSLLAIEAWIVTQIYVNTIKVFTGREGPKDEQGQGVFHGPSGYLKYFPAGTPSGHVASMWALFSVVMQYWQHPAAYVLLSALGVVLTMATVTDRYHFPSEAILGATMGIAIGRWVVRHRSSRYRYADDAFIERFTIAPAIVPGSVYGVGVSFRF